VAWQRGAVALRLADAGVPVRLVPRAADGASVWWELPQ
jgi:hypothetical protein